MASSAQPQAPTLARALRRTDVVCLTLNNMIGAGVFTMPAALAAGAGSASVAVLFFTIVLVSMMALCMVEVASRFDRTGGPMVYADAAFGPGVGFAVGWLMYLSRLAGFGAIAVVMLDYAGGVWPALVAPAARMAILTIFVAALTAVNVRGVARGARMSNMLTVLKLTPLVLVAAAGLWQSRHLASGGLLAAPAGHLGEAILVAFFACMGFESGAVIAGEVRDPRRDVAAGIIGGIGGVAVIYTLLMFACLRAVPDLAHATRPVAAAAETLLGAGGATAVSIVAVLSCAGTLSVWMLTSPRVLYALGVNHDLPRVFATVSPAHKTPAIAIVTSALLVWLLTVSKTFVYLATFAAMSRLLMYGSTCAALIALRRRNGPAPIVIPFGAGLSVIALLASLAAIAATSGTEIRDLAIALAAGWIARTAVRRSRRQDVRAPACM